MHFLDQLLTLTRVNIYIGRLMFLLGGFGIGGAVIGDWFAIKLQQAGQPTPVDWLTGLGGLGVGGVIAGIVITWKRQDDISNAKRYDEVQTSHAKQLESMFSRMESTSDRVLTAFEQNTKTVGQLAINGARDQSDRRGEHERIERALSDVSDKIMSLHLQGSSK